MVHIDGAFVIDPNQLILEQKETGVGTYGEVYRAKWGTIDVAVKKVLIGDAGQHLQQIERELHQLLTTRHPSVLNYYGVCVKSAGEIWIVMEYADGGNLNHFLTHSQHTPKWKWVVEIVHVLDFLHKKQILHNALKSYNFLVVKGELKISDFGMTATAQLSVTHRDAAPKGTARWQAPELASNPAYSEKSDVFSLGMILWEIYEAAIPFADENDDRRLKDMIKNQRMRPPFNNNTPNELLQIIRCCWDDAPQNRPTTTNILNNMQNRSHPSGVAHANKQRDFFEIHYNELLGSIKKEDIRTLNNPPPYPGTDEPPKLPPEITIISLHPPPPQMSQGSHGLISQKYNIRLFVRVLDYFNRFYVPSNPNEEARVERIDVIYNKFLEDRFAHANEYFESKFHGLEELRGNNHTDQQRMYLEQLRNSKNLVTDKNSNPISAFHGANEDKLISIFWYGLLNLSTTDLGYFGKGIYLTQKPCYGEYYAGPSSKGGRSLLLCWVLLGRPYAITQVKLGCPLMANYSSHYALVSNKKLTRDMCATNDDFTKLQEVTNYFPVVGDEPALGDEIVVFHPEQVLPRFVIHYTVGPKTPAATTTFTPEPSNSAQYPSNKRTFGNPSPAKKR